MSEPSASISLTELAKVCLKLGTTAFGGPPAHIAMLREEVVIRRRWISPEYFVDLLGATNLIPGPNSTEMVMHVGLTKRGPWGLLTAGVCFIGPAMLLTMSLAWFYQRYQTLPTVHSLFYGIKPVIVAIIVHALYKLLPTVIPTWTKRGLALVTCAISLLRVNELALLCGVGVIQMLLSRTSATVSKPTTPTSTDTSSKVPQLIPWLGPAVATTAVPVTLSGLWLSMMKIGAILYGSGYVLVAYLRSDFIEQRHWLTNEQLINAIAVGQITPGPVLTTASFIGYLLLGLPGGMVATLGIFTPAFIFVACSGPLIPKLRQSQRFSAFLDGVNLASLALMTVACWQIAQTSLTDVVTITLFLATFTALIRFSYNSSWYVLAGALVGWLVRTLRVV